MKTYKIKHISSLIFTLFIYAYAIDLNAQAICGFDEKYKKEYKNNPILRMKMELFENEMKRVTKNNSARLAVTNSTVYIPVVVHVIHTGGEIGTDFNPDDDMIIEAINYLNKVFNGTRYPQQGIGDIGIQFTLAKRSPSCESTNGIVRKDYSCNEVYKQSGVQFLEGDIGIPELDLKNISRWDPYQYLNIWLVNQINGKNSTNSDEYYVGYSRFPQDPESIDGVVFIADEFFSGNTFLPHEMGHTFNLLHPWGLIAEVGVCGDDHDDVSDTDPVSKYIGPPRTGPNPCNDNKLFSANTEKNIMSYSTCCQTLFTQGQKDRMQASLKFSRRKSLVNSLGDEPIDDMSCGEKIYTISNTFDTANTPVFTTNSFKTLGIGKGGYIYAGTANSGLYKFDKRRWAKSTMLNNNNINDIKTDYDDGIWIAQYGHTGGQAINGGINHFPDSTDVGYTYYPPSTSGLPTRNCRAIFIEKYSSEINPRIWTANMAHTSFDINGNLVSTPGGLGRGLNYEYPFFNNITTEIDINNGIGNIQTIGGDENEIMVFAANNFGKSQILVYNASNGNFLRSYDHTNMKLPNLPSNFIVKSIYFDSEARKTEGLFDLRWFGLSTGGILLYYHSSTSDGPKWFQINQNDIFPPNTIVNNNSIYGDNSGNIFIGTNKGLLVYKGDRSSFIVDDFHLYTTVDGLPSNNILDVIEAPHLGKIIIATDNGIVFWNKSRFPSITEPSSLAISTPNYTTETLTRQASAITASNQITNTAKITYQAKTILFGEGFKAQPTAGGYFKTAVGGCN